MTQTTADDGFGAATQVAQVFSGILFTGLAGWLTVNNGTKLSFIQRASLEKRLTVCCFLNVYVGAFSAFFNFFQLTEVDDIFLPRQNQFVLDLSRPLEWIFTCPVMQLVLVLMGGSRIPEYRRLMMPALSVMVLSCGTASMLLPEPWRFGFYGIGFCTVMVMFYFNRVQILEHSENQEGLFAGDSEFRKASVLLIMTWFPFPLWFACSPEGFGLIQNILVIQMGWAFLNIISKFTFIFYIQRIKDSYCSRLKVKREMYGAQPGMSSHLEAGMMGEPMSALGMAAFDKDAKATGELSAVVVETMTFLGMAQHADRFQRLLKRAEITTLAKVEVLSKEQCQQLQLPWDLVSALQRRLRVWKLEMQDNAEIELDKGEQHYMAETLEVFEMQRRQSFSEADEAERLRLARQATPPGGAVPSASPPLSRQMTPGSTPQWEQAAYFNGGVPSCPESPGLPHSAGGVASDSGDALDARLQRLEELLLEGQRKAEEGRSPDGIERLLDHFGQSLILKMESALFHARMESDHKSNGQVESALRISTDRSEASLDSLRQTLISKIDGLRQAQWGQQLQGAEELPKSPRTPIAFADTELAIEALGHELKSKLESGQAAQLRQQAEAESNLSRKLEEGLGLASDRFGREAEGISKLLQSELSIVISRNDIIGDALREGMRSQADTTADLRRLCMMVLEQVSNTQEKNHQGHNKVVEVQNIIERGIERILRAVWDLESGIGGGGHVALNHQATSSDTANKRPASGHPSSHESAGRKDSPNFGAAHQGVPQMRQQNQEKESAGTPTPRRSSVRAGQQVLGGSS